MQFMVDFQQIKINESWFELILNTQFRDIAITIETEVDFAFS